MSRPTEQSRVAAPSTSVRMPAVAGRFYPGDARQCLATARSYLEPAHRPGDALWRGAVVPHAGWICSGAIAGQAIATLAATRPNPDVVVVFGAIHTPLPVDVAVFDTHDRWRLPGTDAALAADLQHRLGDDRNLFTTDATFHEHEHAVEVELPMVRLAWPNAQVLPVEVPTIEEADQVGQRTAKAVAEAGLDAVYLASSDLTHYGPAYGFTPAGIGVEALDWAADNDRRILELVTTLAVDRVVREVRSRYNACGGGAIAAMLAACLEHGASRGRVLTHANSYQTLSTIAPHPPDNAVGYAGVVIG